MQKLVFESRELKPYAEPVSGADLKVGSIYFFVNYVDEAMLIPELEPVVFIGRNLEPNDDGVVYFQDAASHRHGVQYSCLDDGGDNSNREYANFYCGSENETSHIFEYEKALE